MLITRESDYAVRTVLYLAQDEDRIASVTEISKAIHIPKSFLAKILQRLVQNGIAKSIRGTRGGFCLARKPSKINLCDIIEAIQGPIGINLCAVDSRLCHMSETCAVHPIWVEMRSDIEKRLKSCTVARLIKRRDNLLARR